MQNPGIVGIGYTGYTITLPTRVIEQLVFTAPSLEVEGRVAESHVQSAILNWLLEGYRLLRSEGLGHPKSVKEATERYQHDSDKMVLFFEDNLVADDTAEELTSTVYARYKGWCQENGCYPEGMKNFKQGLQAFAQVVRKRPKQGGEKTTVLLGYRLISEFDPPLLA